jgi:hypothetical protein
MELDKLNRWLTLAANIGVIAGIVFVAFEVQLNTSAIRSATIQAITDASANSLRSLASDPEMAQLRLDGDKDLSSLSDLQAYQYHVYYRQHWLRFQNIFFQRRFGVLEEGVWGTYARIICTDIKTEGIRANWPNHAEVLDPEFVIFVESC